MKECEKEGYSKKESTKVAHRIMKQKNLKIRPYLCGECYEYHVTHEIKR